MTDVTRILNAIEGGDQKATDELLPLVYEELRLLAAQKLSHEKPGQTLQATAWCMRPICGWCIGRYKLLEKIGEGGMAVVYMAEQEQPIRRKVALKIIKLGMDTSR
jgi:serine/threonine protein kinase